MLKWSKPRLTDLSVRYTELGGLGIAADGQMYQVTIGAQTFLVVGTSGPALTAPFTPIP
jgi:hypothetical protein